MNKRIRELMIQCEKKYCQDHDDYFYDMEKFAELIVAECIEVFSKDLPEEGDGKMLEVVNRVCDVAEHFGVKE